MATEHELAGYVVNYFLNLGYSVYKEVTDNYRRADIVAVKDNITTIIEVKKRFNFEVISQSIYWRSRANYIYIAVPVFSRKRWQSISSGVISYLTNMNIGLLTIDKGGIVHSKCTNLPYNHLINPIQKFLMEEQKTFAEAGTRGKYWTRFKQTEHHIIEFLKNRPQSTINEIVDNVQYHYSNRLSAKACIRKAFAEGWISVEEIVFEGKKYYKAKE
jgi:hypothetical protein